MTILTLEDLQSKLARDLAWRKREISGLRVSALRSDARRNYLFRAGLVLLCAHWEGFLRRSIECYVDHVFSQNLKIKELTPEFVALAYFSDVRRAGEANYPGSEENHLKLAKRILRGTEEICARSSWDIRTEGNPGTDVLARLLASVGLDTQLGFDAATRSAMKVYIDEQVVRDRHRVAHGEGFRVSRDEFLERTQRMLDLLDRVSTELLSAAENKAYRVAQIA